MKTKKILLETGKIVVTIILLYILFKKVNVKGLITIFSRVNLWYFALASFMYLAGIFLSSMRWRLFLSNLGINVPLLTLFSHYLKSLFLANFLPSGGLDVARLMFLGKDKIKEKLSSTFMDRVFGFLAINIYVFLGLLYSLQDTGKYAKIVIAALLLQILFFFMLFSKRTAFVFSILQKLPMGEHLYHIYEFLHSFRSKKIITMALFYSFLIQLLYSLDVYFITISTREHAGLIRTILFVPFINFLSMIPVTVSGFGMREGGFVFLFSKYIGKEAAMATSLLYFVSIFLVSVLGAMLLIRFRRK